MDRNLVIHPGETVKTALRRLNENARQILFVVDADQHLLGTLTDGDVRRIILKGVDLGQPLTGLFNGRPYILTEGTIDTTKCREIFLQQRIHCLPIVDAQGKLTDFLTWDQFFGADKHPVQRAMHRRLRVPVVIMAGGKGARLEPFTAVLPKPLVPVGDRTILEHIMGEFMAYGIKNFYLTLNYRGEMIRAYFDGLEKSYQIHYIREKEFLGTAGSLRLLPSAIPKTFFVSNCDIIVKADYAEVLAFHRKQRAALTVISSYQHHVVPYGVVEFCKGGLVLSIREKPEYTFPINTGVYVLDRRVLEFIPSQQVVQMPDLIQSLIEHGERVVTYPVNEKNYLDIGQWDEYRKTSQRMALP